MTLWATSVLGWQCCDFAVLVVLREELRYVQWTPGLTHQLAIGHLTHEDFHVIPTQLHSLILVSSRLADWPHHHGKPEMIMWHWLRIGHYLRGHPQGWHSAWTVIFPLGGAWQPSSLSVLGPEVNWPRPDIHKESQIWTLVTISKWGDTFHLGKLEVLMG